MEPEEIIQIPHSTEWEEAAALLRDNPDYGTAVGLFDVWNDEGV